MTDRFVCDGELAQVVACHLWSDFNLVERLAVVNANVRANHLWDDDHVSQVCLDSSWLLTLTESLFGLSESLQQAERLAPNATNKLSSCTAVDEFNKLREKGVEGRVDS